MRFSVRLKAQIGKCLHNCKKLVKGQNYPHIDTDLFYIEISFVNKLCSIVESIHDK